MKKLILLLLLISTIACTAQGFKNSELLRQGTGSAIIAANFVPETVSWPGLAGSDISDYYIVNTTLRSGQPIKVVYVLPVESLNQTTFGNAMNFIVELCEEGSIKDNTVFVQPRFLTVPWYANHPTDQAIQQEDDMYELYSIIDNRFAGFQTETYNLGFSKSGYGGMSLMINNPTKVDGVMAWDSPLGLDTFITGDMADVFDTEAYLQANYDLIDNLVGVNASLVGKEIHISGYQLWQTLSDAFVTALDTYPSITYTEDDTQAYSHNWHKEWMLDLLEKGGVAITIATPTPTNLHASNDATDADNEANSLNETYFTVAAGVVGVTVVASTEADDYALQFENVSANYGTRELHYSGLTIGNSYKLTIVNRSEDETHLAVGSGGMSVDSGTATVTAGSLGDVFDTFTYSTDVIDFTANATTAEFRIYPRYGSEATANTGTGNVPLVFISEATLIEN